MTTKNNKGPSIAALRMRDIADALGVTKRAAEKLAAKRCWSYREEVGRGGLRRLYRLSDLPADVQAALIRQFPELVPTEHTRNQCEYDRDALWQWAAYRPESLRIKGESRARLLLQLRKLIGAGHSFRQAAAAVSNANDVSAATLRNWYYGVNNQPGAKDYDPSDWAAILIPGYSGRTATAACNSEAWDYFKADYLRLEQPSATACYERLRRAAKEHGWTVPSLRALQRRLEREISRAARILARQGAEALKRTYPAQERDRSVFHALEAVNADGHRFDVFVRWPDGEIARPNMVAWQDLYSGKLLAWRVDKTENTDAVRLSFGDLVDRFGIPSSAYLDNGRGFASKWMTGGTPNRYRFKVREEEPAGILTNLGIDVHWTTPYHGQAKPIERAFLDLCEYVARHPALAGAYTGNKPTAKPENYGSRAVKIEDFLGVLEQEIHAHNARRGRRAKVCNGRSFDEVFADSYARSPIRKATVEQRRLWLLAAENVTVRADGTIVLQTDRRNRYWCAALFEHAAQSVVARFDPQDLHRLVHVYTLDGRYIDAAACIQAAGFNDTEAARAHARARNQWKRAARVQLDAERRMDTLDVARLLPDITPAKTPDARVVRPLWPTSELRETVQPAPMSKTERDELARFREEFAHQPTPVIDTDDPWRRFERWARIAQRITDGESVSDEDRSGLARYRRSDEYRSLQEFYDDFGLSTKGKQKPA